MRRRGIRKTTERRNGVNLKVEEKEDDDAGRDRRTRIFSTTGKKEMMKMGDGDTVKFVIDQQSEKKI